MSTDDLARCRRRPGPSVGVRVARRLILTYQLVFSWRPTPCRFVPTCSDYGLDAFEQHGLVRGGVLTARRVLRCNPLTTASGWDPVPARRGGSCPVHAEEVRP